MSAGRRGLEKALDRMRAAWHGLDFRVLAFKDTGTYILGGVDDVQACAPSPVPGKQGARVILNVRGKKVMHALCLPRDAHEQVSASDSSLAR